MTEKESNFWAKIDTFALSEDETGKVDSFEQELFSIRCQHGSIHGPFPLLELKDSLQENPNWRNFSIRPLGKNYWIPLGEHPLFDQRKAARRELLQSLSPETTNIHLNIKGRSSGPYSFKEIEEKVVAGELLPCDLINPDPEQSLWIRLFEIQYFNPKKGLPNMPIEQLLENTGKKSKNTIDDNQTDPIVELAQLEKTSKSEDIPSPDLNHYQTMTSFPEKIKIFWNKSPYAIIGLSLLTMAIASIPLFRQKPQQASQIKTEKKSSSFSRKATRNIAKPKPKLKSRPKPRPIIKSRPVSAKKRKPLKFFPTKSHSVIPDNPPAEQETYEEETYEKPYEEQDDPGYNEEELIDALESSPDSDDKDRNPSSDSDDNLGEIPDDAIDTSDPFFDEEIEFSPRGDAYDR